MDVKIGAQEFGNVSEFILSASGRGKDLSEIDRGADRDGAVIVHY